MKVRRRRVVVVALVLAAVLVICGCARASHRPGPAGSPQPSSSRSPSATASGVVPAYLLNPAVTQDTIATTICVAGWTATVRPSSSYTTALKRRQLPAGADLAAYEEDHLVPLALGGAPRDERNLWPQLWADARRKDRAETALQDAVCDGRATLAQARRDMYFGWRPPDR